MAQSRLVTPKLLFRRAAVAEAITWALLLVGMFLKYVTETTELGVQVFGMVHGVVFITYCLVTVATWTNQKWPARVGLLGLVSAIPPFATVLFDRRTEEAGQLEGPWRFSLGGERPSSLPERALAWLTRNPVLAAVVAVVAVAGLTGVALFVGPPAAGS
jgi:integral membrane protein